MSRPSGLSSSRAPRRSLVLALAAVLLVPASLGSLGVVASASPGSGAPPSRVDADRIALARERSAALGDAVARGDVPLERQVAHRGPVTAMIELEAAPATRRYRAALADGGRVAAGAASRSAVAEVERQAEAVVSRLDERSTRADVLFRVTKAYSGVAVTTDASRLPALRALPGVAGVHVMTPKERQNTESVPLIGGPAAWQTGAPGTGEGVTIGIIDSGIDYTHATFGGPGTVEAYATAKAAGSQAPTYPDPAKVAGGHDFAGDGYDPDNGVGATPDSNPLDCDGHGTHVAGTAAGYGVTSAGTTYAGPWDASTDFGQFAVGEVTGAGVGPGVAPRATLYALKVFGCAGSTYLVTQALDWAADPDGDGDVSDHLDVVNMSLASDYTAPDDPDAVATDNAALAGVTVVASAGNAGDLTDVSGSPGNATRALSVAASDDGGADLVADFSSRGRRAAGGNKPDVTAPGLSTFSAAVGSGDEGASASGTSMAAPHVAGVAALVVATHPTWTPEQVKAAVMGTAAAPVRKTAGGVVLTPTRVGAGRVQADRAAGADVLAFSVPTSVATTGTGAVSVGFGPVSAPAGGGKTTTTRYVRVVNHGAGSRTFSVVYQPVKAVPGASYVVSPATLTLEAGAAATVTVALTLDPATLRRSRDVSMAATEPVSGTPRAFVTEASGRVSVQEAGVEKARVPVSATVRPTSTMSASPASTFPVGSRVSVPVYLKGTGLTSAGFNDQGQVVNADTGYASWLSALELQATDEKLTVPFPSAAAGDVRYAAVGSDAAGLTAFGYDAYEYVAGDAEKVGSYSYFGITAWAPWSTPASFAQYEVSIDTDRDGTADFVTFNGRYGDSDVFVAVTVDATTNQVVDEGISLLDDPYYGAALDLGQFDSTSLVMPVFNPAIGLTAAAPRFDWWVESGTVGTGYLDAVGSASQPLSFNAARPGVALTEEIGAATGTPVPWVGFLDLSSTQVRAVKDVTTYKTDKALGLWLAHHHNGASTRTQVLRIKQRQTLTTPYGATISHKISAGKWKLGAATSTSGLPVTASSVTSSRCTYASGYVTPRTAGDCGLRFTQAGNLDYVATSVTKYSKVVDSTRTVLASSDTTSYVGQSVTLTGTVTRAHAGGTTITGSVKFYDGTKLLKTATVRYGKASVRMPTLARGTHYLKAVYVPSGGYYTGSTSPSVKQVVR